MKNRKLLLIVSLVLAMTMSLGGTLAYLTDTDADVNVMTVGRVEIVQNEQDSEGNDFEQYQQLLPIVGNTTEKDDNGYVSADNYIDKIVTVTNTGNTDAWVRTLIAVPQITYNENVDDENASNNVLHWNGYGEGHDTDKRPAAGQLPGTLEKVANHWWWGKENAESAWPGNNGDWNRVENVVIGKGEDAVTYTVYIVTHTTEVEGGETTAPNMTGLYLDSRVDYDNDKDTYTITVDGKEYEIAGLTENVEIRVLSQAVQASGFDTAWKAFKDAFDNGADQPSVELLQTWLGGLEVPVAPTQVSTAAELVEALNNDEDVILTTDIEEIPVENTAPYGNYYGIKQDGETIDGNGKTLNFDKGLLHDGRYDNYGIMTSGGTIRNLTIEEGCRAVMIMSPTEDVILENVNIGGDGVLYAINTGEAGADGVKLSVTNSTLAGWTSYGPVVESASFTNVEFGQGTYYGESIYGRVLKPYVNTTIKNCSFIEHFNLDLSELGEGCKVTIENCTVAGQELTAALCTIPETNEDYDKHTFTVDLPDWATSVTDCVIFN